MKKTTPATSKSEPSAAIKRYLVSGLPVTARIRLWHQQTESDLAKFKKYVATRPDNTDKRSERREIKKWFGKPVAELTLAEWQDYQKPSFHAAEYLKELWPQLTPAEQDLVKQCNEWAFLFAGGFEKEERFLRACASRLEQFFERKFRVSRRPKSAAIKTT
jgi:hypothetical protein